MTSKQREHKNRDNNNPKIRVPKSLFDRIERLAEELREAYEQGKATLPDGVDCENIPRWAVIAKALDELESHRERSRKAKKSKRKPE